MIQGIQRQPDANATAHSAAVYSVLGGFGEQNVHITDADSETLAQSTEPSTSVQFGPSTSFSEAGRQLAERLTLNQRQSIALRLICRQLDRVWRDESGTPQLCQFVRGEGGTGKSRIIEALAELFAGKGISHRLLVTATSGTAAARINGITIHSACNFSKDTSRTGNDKDVDGITSSNSADLCIDGQARMDWQEKYLLIIDELRGSAQDFDGIPIVLFCGDFHQFRPVQERSILLPSTAFPWDEEKTFTTEQRYQHDRAHALWSKFTTVFVLKEQVRAAGDPRLQRLLTRIRQGVQDQSDLNLLNSTCYREGRRIPWESGITVVTTLNRNRWNLNIEATCLSRGNIRHRSASSSPNTHLAKKTFEFDPRESRQDRYRLKALDSLS
ncbi:DNA helicase PIF1 ATP-dependent [Macrophomina phaseolina MS6]|uniref:ATP-dependent DNA helicase n=1 Tax=Macrophomina phaseolina (strain MS6) TaxID=1126212 RepID=K2R7S1_MACPH|nr:DNA helicase PIF1 ATP-dependent [Macrophomina phaseolina MS6]